METTEPEPRMKMETKESISITSGGAGNLDLYPRAASTLSEIFLADPGITYMLCSLTLSSRKEYILPYFNTLMKAASLNSAEFVVAEEGQGEEGWECVSVWLPPGMRVDGLGTVLRAGFVGCLVKLGWGGGKRMLIDYQSQSNACKKRALPKDVKRYWYLFFIGTKEEARGKGLATRIIQRQQSLVGKENLPIWLEATTTNSRDVYKKCGFEVVGEFVLGEGTHAKSGEIEKGGEGVRIWAMFWRPGKDGEVREV